MNTKRYFTPKELGGLILEETSENKEWLETGLKAQLDYTRVSRSEVELRQCEFDVYAETRYGGSEGIYTVIIAEGYITGNQRERISLITLKTLETSREVYLAISALGALLAYNGCKIVNEYLDRFD